MSPQLYDALSRTHLSGLGLWWHLYPVLQRGRPFGYTDMTADDMAAAFGRRIQGIRQGLFELRKAGVIVRNDDGTYESPLMRDARRNAEMREQLKSMFARYRMNGYAPK